MKTITRWKLLKDLPDAPAGTISTKESSDQYAYFGPPEDPYAVQHYVPYMRRHPDWFMEIGPHNKVLVCEWDEVDLPQPISKFTRIDAICEDYYTPSRWWIEER